MKKLIILTGAGVSAESGIRTFREAGGLWENYDIHEVATPEAWERDPELVLGFYNDRRKQLLDVQPNAAHLALVELEAQYDITIITQNIDDLHERGGSRQIIHLHGELVKARSTADERLLYHWPKDILLGDTCELGSQLRPHVVWFGETVPKLYDAAMAISEADMVMIIGTSMQVYPAAGLVGYAPADAPVYYIDPHPSINYELSQTQTLEVIAEPATVGVPKVAELIS